MSSTVDTTPDNTLAVRPNRLQQCWAFCRKEPLGTFGLVLVVVMLVTGALAEVIAPYNPTANDFAAMTEPPSFAHLLGTDQFDAGAIARRRQRLVGALAAWHHAVAFAQNGFAAPG